MLAELKRNSPEEAREHRIALGLWLRTLREERGLSQRALADILSLEYYTFISQLETGRGKIPEQRYAEWAEALGQEPKDFVKVLMSYYQPTTYRILFEDGYK
jgi:transcriptional regulator with XRE-family HTH domain